MCGIAGFVSSRPVDDRERILERMMVHVAHRGPDGRGVWHSEHASLGHHRLAVVALGPDGAQPMQLGSTIISWNGELYSASALRRDIVATGRVPRTATDTELLLLGYDAFGMRGLLERVDGMFAIALYDARLRKLHLARDAMGEKPLYVSQRPNGGVVFASGLRAVVQHPDVMTTLSPTAIRKLLAYEFVPAPRTIFTTVDKLEAGECRVYVDARYTEALRWTRLPQATGDARGEALWPTLVEATRSRLVSDVPVGVFLSGGLDSSAVAAAATEAIGRVSTYTLGFDEASFDESAHARAVAKHLGTTHHEARLTLRDGLDAIPAALDAIDEPHADSSFLPTSMLARFARREITVALGGDGGDELFLGYPTFVAHEPAKLIARLPPALREGVLKPLVAALPTSHDDWSFDYRVKRFIDGLDLSKSARHLAWIAGTHPRGHRDLLEPAVFAAAQPDPFDDVERHERLNPSGAELDRLAAIYLRLYLGEGVLQKVDRATMRYGLECRAPLLAPSVVALARRLPVNLKLRGTTTKWILREALKKKLPRAILDRPKKGFGVPLSAWLRGPLVPLCRELLDAATLRRQAIFKAETVERLLTEHQRGWRDHRTTLWTLLVFQSFLRTFRLW